MAVELIPMLIDYKCQEWVELGELLADPDPRIACLAGWIRRLVLAIERDADQRREEREREA
jgi:hypothetical protein